MLNLQEFIDSVITNASLHEAVITGYTTIFEESYHNSIPVTNSAQAMGDYKNIMKQVNVGVVPGNGMGIDKQPNHHVNDSIDSMRDIKEETMTRWSQPKKGAPPIKANAPKFVDKAINMAQDHLPVPMTGDIPSSERRFSMIYPTLNTGVNISAPRIGV